MQFFFPVYNITYIVTSTILVTDMASPGLHLPSYVLLLDEVTGEI